MLLSTEEQERELLIRKGAQASERRFTRAELDEKLELGQWLLASGWYWWRKGRYIRNSNGVERKSGSVR
jgi:hypothetical protein